MQLYFKQRFFSWFDSYDIYDEEGNTVFTVEGQLSWGHCLHVNDAMGRHIATLQQRVLTLLPKFEMYIEENYVGCITKELTFFKPRFVMDCNGWEIDGEWMEWDYTITDSGRQVATVSKDLFHMTDRYMIDVAEEDEALAVLLVVLAIDAEKCSRG